MIIEQMSAVVFFSQWKFCSSCSSLDSISHDFGFAGYLSNIVASFEGLPVSVI